MADGDPQGLARCNVALCLWGGGYRAMLFHVGALWRLNELGHLAKLDRISSVSGGSITAGVLAKHWDALDFEEGVAQAFKSTVATELHEMAGHTIDIWAVLRGTLWFGTVGNRIAGSYRHHLFGTRTLQDLPEAPRFFINSTSLQTGVLWRFSRPYMADHRVGMIRKPTVQLANAVAASSAFRRSFRQSR
jgi:NTE family protein